MIQDFKQRYPSNPYPYSAGNVVLTDKTANGLTKLIIKWCELHGYQAERISVTGRAKDDTKVITDVLGRRRQIGSVKWLPSTMTKGSADISATIKGRSVKIEVKIGQDRQSDAQIKYQKSVEAAGGVYMIAKTFDQFVEDITNIINQ